MPNKITASPGHAPSLKATKPKGVTVNATPAQIQTLRDAQKKFDALAELARFFSPEFLERQRTASLEIFANAPTEENLVRVFEAHDRILLNRRELALTAIARARTKIRDHSEAAAAILNQIAEQTEEKAAKLARNEHADAEEIGGVRIETSSLPSTRAHKFAEQVRQAEIGRAHV